MLGFPPTMCWFGGHTSWAVTLPVAKLAQDQERARIHQSASRDHHIVACSSWLKIRPRTLSSSPIQQPRLLSSWILECGAVSGPYRRNRHLHPPHLGRSVFPTAFRPPRRIGSFHLALEPTSRRVQPQPPRTKLSSFVLSRVAIFISIIIDIGASSMAR
jgi:hypothetical protein